MSEQVGISSAQEFDDVYRHMTQALVYANLIVDSARQLTAEVLATPRRDGKRRVDRILETTGQPAAEMAAQSFVVSYFYLADELAKLKVVPRRVWQRLESVASHTCGHSRACKFADDVAFAMRDCWRLEDSRFPDTKERPTTESQRRTVGMRLAPSLLQLKNRLGDLDVPDSDDLQQTMLVERAKATNGAASSAKTVYISYAWGDDRSDAGRQRSEAVERLSEKLIEWGHEIVRDKTELNNGDLISKFMQRIGRGNHVLVILSEKYLLSPNCMTELFYVYQRSIGDKEDFLRRVIPVVVDDACGITEWREHVKYAEHWQREFQAMESHLSVLGEDQQKRHRLIKQWHAVIGDILGFISDKLHPHGFDNIVKDDFAAVRELLAKNVGEPIDS